MELLTEAQFIYKEAIYEVKKSVCLMVSGFPCIRNTSSNSIELKRFCRRKNRIYYG